MSDPTSAPIIVDATPTQAQLAAGIRQLLLGAGAIATAFGAAHLGQGLSTAALAATVIATGLSGGVTIAMFIMGQLHVRHAAQKLAVTAAAAPDYVAQVKQP